MVANATVTLSAGSTLAVERASSSCADAVLHLQLTRQAESVGAPGSARLEPASQPATMEEGGEFATETDLKACPGCQRVKPMSQFHRNRTKCVACSPAPCPIKVIRGVASSQPRPTLSQAQYSCSCTTRGRCALSHSALAVLAWNLISPVESLRQAQRIAVRGWLTPDPIMSALYVHSAACSMSQAHPESYSIVPSAALHRMAALPASHLSGYLVTSLPACQLEVYPSMFWANQAFTAGTSPGIFPEPLSAIPTLAARVHGRLHRGLVDPAVHVATLRCLTALSEILASDVISSTIWELMSLRDLLQT